MALIQKFIEKSDLLLSKERGTIYKDPGGKINIALVYPNTYPVGMSSLGFQGIYGLLNGFPDVVCERVFLPSSEELEEYERTRAEIFSLESKRPLARFDIIAFSVSFENDYPNIVRILDLSRIPLRHSDRSASDPLVVMGGVCAFYNPEPMAEFLDLCFIGEAEEMLPEFLAVFRESRSKDELYRKVTGIEGIYLPALYSIGYSDLTGLIEARTPVRGAPEKIRKRTVSDISETFFRPVISTPEAEFSEMYLLEAMRGCPWACRFCVAGHLYNPPRKKSLPALKDEIAHALESTNRVGLIGPSLSDYPHADEILGIEGVDFSITSLRANPRTGNLVNLLKGHKSVSIAPEAGTERLRRAINKKITEEDILAAAGLILDGGIETLRLYFMVGLPTETKEDIEGIIGLVKKIRQTVSRGFITLSVSTFVPKPFTPFQWHEMAPIKEIKDRLRMIKKGLSGVRGVRVFHDVPKYAYVQGVFSRGDRRTSAAIEAMGRGKEAGALNDAFYIFRRRDFAEILPWDFIDAGISKESLWREYLAALSE